MSGDLLALASKYVSLTGEIEDVRRAMLACLTNGAADAARTPRPMQARPKPGSHPNALKAAEAEAKMIELLRASPGMRTTAIAQATGAKKSTVTERLRRLQARGQVERGEEGDWTAPG
jgi:hypothetical protein